MKFLNLNKVLCLSAHPDDTEYGVLGSMISCDDTLFDATYEETQVGRLHE